MAERVTHMCSIGYVRLDDIALCYWLADLTRACGW